MKGLFLCFKKTHDGINRDAFSRRFDRRFDCRVQCGQNGFQLPVMIIHRALQFLNPLAQLTVFLFEP